MNIIDSILARKKKKPRLSNEAESSTIIDRADDGSALYEEDIIVFLRGEYERRRTERRAHEAQWTLNANFLSGNQHCGINPYNLELEDYAAERDYMEHGVFNRIAPLIETRLANLKTVSYSMRVRPRTGELDDYEKSVISTRLLRYTQDGEDFEGKKNQLLHWSELCGSAFALSWWQGDGGEDGEGALAFGIVTPFEVFPDSLDTPTIEGQRSVLLCQVKSTAEIYDLYGVNVQGEDIDTYTLAPVGSIEGYSVRNPYALNVKRAQDSAYVITYFERPTAKYKGGRLIISAGGRIVWYGELPFGKIPLCMLKCKEMPGRFFGRSVIEELIPLQRAYNGTKNKIHDYIRSTAANPLLVPEGAINDITDLADRGLPPGEIVEYDAERGKPEPLSVASLPAEVRYECQTLASDMEYVAGVSSLMVYGTTPSGVTSGTAIETLRAIDNTRLALSGENLRSFIRELAELWLGIYKNCASGYRVLEISGNEEVGGAMTWCAEDINSFNIEFEAENELLNSAESQKETFLRALSMGLLGDEDGGMSHEVKRRALEVMKIGNYSELLGEDELHTKRARREGDMLMCGTSPTVGTLDDHRIHISEHRRFALGVSFDALERRSPELAQAFLSHISEHQAALLPGGEDNV